MTDLNKILEEIYKIDPSLKNREGEIIKAIGALSALRPEVQIDEAFMASLRAKLDAEARTMKTATKPHFNFQFSGTPYLARVFAVFLVMLGAVYFYNMPGAPMPPDLGGKTISENKDGTVVVETDKGIVIVDKNQTSGDGGAAPKILSGFVKFSSDAEYREYLAEAEKISGTGSFGQMRTMAVQDVGIANPTSAPAMLEGGSAEAPARVSETNVQVAGVDEPDILKTDGKEIYFSPQSSYYYRMMPMGGAESMMIAPPDDNQAKTHVIKAFPATSLAEDSSIEKTGNLLLSGKILTVFGNQEISGYDISDPKKPAEKWVINLDGRNSVVEARLFNGLMYLITRTQASRYDPCPIPLFESAGGKIIVPCTGIYHPSRPVQVSTNYHLSTIDPASGKIAEKISFVGSYNSTVYMSRNAIYVAYGHEPDMLNFFLGLFTENADIIPQDITDRITKLAGYDISNSSKIAEISVILEDFRTSLNDDERLKLESEMENRGKEYLKKHKRELQKTDIVRIAIDDLKVKSLGTIPGTLLNQFALDEYKGNLRAATTVGGQWFGGMGTSGESENDVYVMDGNLSVIGKIQGLGLTERIYSARFIQDKGYLVTFRQVDPFFVLDLANPKNPKVSGELKIPGYSSYLHPITKDLIIGVGMESSKVKISLFDTSDPKNPVEASKYSLNEYWTDVTNTHHAFLLDDKHKIFFMPGSQGGYIFSYESNKLALKKAVSGISAKRAVYIDDFLYVAGDNKIIVLDENTWERVKELDL